MVFKNELEEELAKVWPPQRITVECSVCGTELYDTKKTNPEIHSPTYVAMEIAMRVNRHYDSTDGHDQINVDIEVPPTPVKKIDCQINIGECDG